MQYHEDENELETLDSKSLMNAVLSWYRFYEQPFDEKSASVLCDAALQLRAQGCDEREIAGYLIEAYHGILSTRANAPSSISRH